MLVDVPASWYNIIMASVKYSFFLYSLLGGLLIVVTNWHVADDVQIVLQILVDLRMRMEELLFKNKIFHCSPIKDIHSPAKVSIRTLAEFGNCIFEAI
jgi:hypothetical protein